MASVDKRVGRNGITYRARVRVAGREPVTQHFTRKTDAQHWANKLEADIRDGRVNARHASQRATLGAVIDRYITDVLPQRKEGKKKTVSHLTWWKSELGARFLRDVTVSDISAAKDKLLKQSTRLGRAMSAATVVRYMAALSHVYSMAVREWQLATNNPVAHVSKPKLNNGRDRVLTVAEIVRLEEACKKSPQRHLYAIFIFSLLTGARRSETMRLRWDDIDLTSARAVLKVTKNGQPRSLPLNPKLVTLLKRRRPDALARGSFVFPSSTGRAPVVFEKHWQAALKKAELSNFRFHDLRHTFASYLAMNGATLTELADALGHKTLQMVRRYAHLTEQHQTERVLSMTSRLLDELDRERNRN